MGTFDITTNQTAVTVASGESARLTFTATNLTDGPVEGQASIEWANPQGKQTWASVVGEPIISFAAKESRQIAVTLTPPTKMPPEAQAASHNLKLVMVDLTGGAGDRSESPSSGLTFKEPEKAAQVPWLIVAIVAAVIVVGGGLLVWALSGPGGGDGSADAGLPDVGQPVSNPVRSPCDSDRDCVEPLLCLRPENGGAGKCLYPAGGRGCKNGPDCITGRCQNGICVASLVGVGGSCADEFACDANLTCQGNVCRMMAGARGCASDDQCVTNKCERKQCVSSVPTLGQACTNTCSLGLTCSNKVCRLPNNRNGCSRNNHCISGYCGISNAKTRVCKSLPNMTSRPLVDYRGSDYLRSVGGNAKGCRDKCQKDYRCRAYTWVRPGVQVAQAVCYLKDRVPRGRANPCCVSGIKR